MKHLSDCAMHNAPALAVGVCDCGGHHTGFEPGSSMDVASRVSWFHTRAAAQCMGVEWFETFLADIKNGTDPVKAAADACAEWDC
jgi:hypothetical protein